MQFSTLSLAAATLCAAGLAQAAAPSVSAIQQASQASLRDRVYGIKETLFHDPYYQRHVIGAPVLRGAGDDGIRCESNYAVFRTKLNGLSTVFNVGRYIDRVVSTPAGLKFSERLAIYDSEMIPNSIIYPV